MRTLIKNNKKYLFAFFLQLSIVCVTILFAVCSFWLNKSQWNSFFVGIFEKRSINELETYHADVQEEIQQYFKIPENVLLNAINSQLSSLLEQNNSLEIQKVLDFMVNIDVNFWTVSIQDSKGIIKYVSTKNPALKAGIGMDFSKREYFVAALKEKKPIYSHVLIGALTKNPIIAISIPILKNGNISHVLTGFISLDQLNKNFTVSKQFYEKYSILTDDQGNIIVSNSADAKNVQNITHSEPLFAKLKESGSSAADTHIEYNFINDKVFVKGKRIAIGKEGYKVYLFNFLKVNSFENEKNQVMQTVTKTGKLELMVWVVINILIMINMRYILQIYERFETKTKAKTK